MSFADVEERPSKKRRFFLDTPPEPEAVAQSLELEYDATPPPAEDVIEEGQNEQPPKSTTRSGPGLDIELIESVVGEKLTAEVVKRLHELAGDNVERGLQCLRFLE